jgi:hypothetical protein
MTDVKHTPGPWRWELNEEHKVLHLVGGRPQYDLTIIQPTRWGTGSATLLIRDTAHDGMNLLHKLHERRDWVVPFVGREHHASWCADVSHPDMRLIAAAPNLLEAAQAAWNCIAELPPTQARVEVALLLQGAIEKAIGTPHQGTGFLPKKLEQMGSKK